MIADSGRMDADVECRVAKASKAFGALRKAVFLNRNLSLQTKRKVNQACVLSVLQYGAEYCIPLRRQVKQLNTFHPDVSDPFWVFPTSSSGMRGSRWLR